MQLVGKLAHEPQPHGAHRDHPLDHEFAIAAEGERLVGEIRIGDLLKDLARIRARDVDHTQGVGEVDDMVVPAVVAGVIAEPLRGFAGAGGGGGEVVIVFRDFHHDAVVDHASVLVAHGRVFDFTRRHLGHVADVDALQHLEGVGPVEAELAQGGAVEHPHVVAHVEDLFAAAEVLREIARPLPHADAAEHSAVALLQLVERRALAHVVMGPGIGGEQRRHQGHPRRGGNRGCAGQRLVPGGEQGQVVAGDASLARAGAGRGEAFDQLGDIEAHVDCLLDVLDGGVLVEADEALAPLDRCGHQFGAPLGAGKLAEPGRGGGNGFGRVARRNQPPP